MSNANNQEGPVTYEVIARALFDNYESIYSIDLETNAYNVYHESESYEKLALARSGDDFFATLPKTTEGVIDPEDRDYVLAGLAKEALVKGVMQEKYYTLVYRIRRNGAQVYHQLRATLQHIDGKDYILMGLRDIDAITRRKIARRDELDSERQKAGNYLEAVLATSIAYIDANLTTDTVLERSSGRHFTQSKTDIWSTPPTEDLPRYSDLHAWICENLVHVNDLERYDRIGSRESLLECFGRGDGRTSVVVNLRAAGGELVPCREVFYLYREHATGDIHVLCITYDLTQQQRQEKELEDLKLALEMSRIRNSTSQMQPHFLYNALGSIQEVMLDEPDRAAKLLEDFTIHLRGCIRAMDSDRPIPFEQELGNIRAYVNIEHMRFGDKLKVEFDVREKGFSVLPLSIQPLVENSIRHGIYRRGPRGGTVKLASWAEGDAWVIQVSDNGVGFDMGKYENELHHGGIDSAGLKNIRFRLEKIMDAELDVESTPDVGTTATVRIPRKGSAI